MPKAKLTFADIDITVTAPAGVRVIDISEKVKSLEDKPRMGGPLTGKEIAVLSQLGKLSKDDVDRMAVDDLPTDYRLACQLVVRDEDVLVDYNLG